MVESTVVQALDGWVEREKDRLASTFLENGEEKEAHLSVGELAARSRALAARLSARGLRGERALILCAPGLDYIAALFGCFYSGAIAVPVYPAVGGDRALERLRAIREDAGAYSSAPNFAFDLCVRQVPPAERVGLDLRCWRVAISGAEPIREDTIRRFADAFGPAGFQSSRVPPCYGLAEATLLVTGNRSGEKQTRRSFARAALAEGRAEPDPEGQSIVSCGRSAAGTEVRIVDPSSCVALGEGYVGEIWVQSGSVAGGYWNQPEATAATFGAHVAVSGDGPFLRTGDLGFLLDGELFVVGRSKDLIVIRGRNHHPQDLEATVERCHPAIRAGSTAAFAIVRNDEDKLVIATLLDRAGAADLDAVRAAVHAAITRDHRIAIHDLVLFNRCAVPKTSSGKIERHRCRALYLEGMLDLL